MKKSLIISLTFIALVSFFHTTSAQKLPSGPEYIVHSVHNGNLVKTVFQNNGVVGFPQSEAPRGAWKYTTNGYIGDVSPIIGVEITDTTKDGEKVTFHAVETSAFTRPASSREEQAGELYGFYPVSGYNNPDKSEIAMSDNPDSWPDSWPDKGFEFDGFFNSYFGKETDATQESFFVMDDNGDKEFNYASNNEWHVNFKPDSTNPNRNGLGLKVEVRGMQWSAATAQDVIFWLYKVTNTSTTDYEKVSFGSLVGTYVGVTSNEDYSEYADDWSFFDVQRDLTYTGDFDQKISNPFWTGSQVGMVGYAFLESPGNPYDGIDNDRDAEGMQPEFVEEDFEERILEDGDIVISIDDDYKRHRIEITNNAQEITTRGGLTFNLKAGDTLAAEGDTVTNDVGKKVINPNALDGKDNDLDGLIDENYYLHYRQVRKDQDGNILFDKLNPTQYVDYINSSADQSSMIDERRDDGIDNDGDWDPLVDDVGTDGVAGTDDADGSEGNGIPDPGEPKFDETDPDESDQIGLTGFNYFAPAGEFPMGNDEELWDMMHPGFFDVPSSIQNGEPVSGEDGDFVYSSGFFPLPAGETKTFSIALVYGNNRADLIDNTVTAKEIYDSEYKFAKAPERPTVKATTGKDSLGNSYVKLYWDRIAEESVDPVTHEKDFQGYKIVKSTQPSFEDMRIVTDSRGEPQTYKTMTVDGEPAIFDKNDSISGEFYPSRALNEDGRGRGFYLGDNSGLKHTFIDKEVTDGQTYYYAVCAYDKGYKDKDIYPQINKPDAEVTNTGEVRTGRNTVQITAGPKAPGYTSSEGDIDLENRNKIGDGTVAAEIVDPSELEPHTYKLTFLDEATDYIDNDGDWSLAEDDLNNDSIPSKGDADFGFKDPDELRRMTTSYTILDTNLINVTIKHRDTTYVNVGYKNLKESTITVKDTDGKIINSNGYEIRINSGFIRAKDTTVFSTDSIEISFKYYPVFRSKNIEGNPLVEEAKDSDIFDGIQMVFNNIWEVNQIDSLTGWNFEGGYNTNFGSQKVTFGDVTLNPVENYPADYDIIFYDDQVRTANRSGFIRDTLGLSPSGFPDEYLDVPINFKVKNMSDNYEPALIYLDFDNNDSVSPLDQIYLFDRNQFGDYFHTSQIIFKKSSVFPDSTFDLGSGDSLRIRTTKPFRTGDLFYFTPTIPKIDTQKVEQEMEKITVFPNPYVAANKLEPKLPPGKTSGRGERKIFFKHVPNNSIIRIFNVRGSLVDKFKASSNKEDGMVSWNLKSKENLPVAAGVYFYVIDTKHSGTIKGKLAIIK